MVPTLRALRFSRATSELQTRDRASYSPLSGAVTLASSWELYCLTSSYLFQGDQHPEFCSGLFWNPIILLSRPKSRPKIQEPDKCKTQTVCLNQVPGVCLPNIAKAGRSTASQNVEDTDSKHRYEQESGVLPGDFVLLPGTCACALLRMRSRIIRFTNTRLGSSGAKRPRRA